MGEMIEFMMKDMADAARPGVAVGFILIVVSVFMIFKFKDRRPLIRWGAIGGIGFVGIGMLLWSMFLSSIV